jgi:hypothetical protein
MSFSFSPETKYESKSNLIPKGVLHKAVLKVRTARAPAASTPTWSWCCATARSKVAACGR